MFTSHSRPRRALTKVAVGGIMAAALALTSCSSGDGSSSKTLENGDQKEISIGIPSGWDEGVAVSALWTQILEDDGYEVSSKTADIGVVFTGLSKGDFNVLFDAWLPITHKDYVDKYQDDITDLGTWYKGATLNIAVNEDSPAKTIEDLKTMGDQYGNKLVGIDPGAGLTKQTKKAIEAYGLDNLDYTTSSTPAMLAELKGAVKSKKNIAVTLWHPHWAYAAYPIRDLKDPKGVMGKGESIHSYGDKDFATQYPTAAKLFKEFSLSDEQLAQLENDMNDAKGDTASAAKKWLDDNPDFLPTLKKKAGVDA